MNKAFLMMIFGLGIGSQLALAGGLPPSAEALLEKLLLASPEARLVASRLIGRPIETSEITRSELGEVMRAVRAGRHPELSAELRAAALGKVGGLERIRFARDFAVEEGGPIRFVDSALARRGLGQEPAPLSSAASELRFRIRLRDRVSPRLADEVVEAEIGVLRAYADAVEALDAGVQAVKGGEDLRQPELTASDELVQLIRGVHARIPDLMRVDRWGHGIPSEMSLELRERVMGAYERFDALVAELAPR